MITQDRQREITLHVFDEDITEESIADLSIEETIFLVKEIERFKENFPEERFKNNHNKAVFNVILKLRMADTLYIILDSATKYPFIIQGTVQVYSKKEYAEAAVKRFKDNHRRNCEVLEVPKSNPPFPKKLPLFAYLHYLGMEKVVVEDGQTVSIVLRRNDILKVPDMEGMAENLRPLINGPLQYSLIQFFQEVRWPVQYQTRDEVVKKKEEIMLTEIVRAKFLMPMKKLNGDEIDENGRIQMKPDSKIQFAIMKNHDGMSFVPAFTDWPEMEKVYDKNIWAANLIPFQVLCNFADKYDGFVINPAGCNFLGNKQNVERLKAFMEEKGL